MKLRTKVSLLVSGVAVSFILIVSGVALYYQEQMLRNSTLAGVDSLARASSINIAAFIKYSMQDANVIASGVPLRAITVDARNSELYAYLAQIAPLIPRFDNGIFLLDKQGRFLADYPPHPELRGKTFEYRDYFKQAASKLQPALGEPYISARTRRPVQTLAVPLLDSDGALLAVLGCSVDLLGKDGLGSIAAQKFGESGYIYTFDRSSRLMITHPEKDRILKRDVPPGANKLLDAAIDGYQGVGETINSKGVAMLTSVHGVAGTNWLVAAQQPLEEVLAPVRETRLTITGITLGAMLLAVVLGNLVATRITRPLKRLQDAALSICDDLAIEDEQHPISEKSLVLLGSIRNNDELLDLSGAFQALTERLFDKVHSLDQALALTKQALSLERIALGQQTQLVALISHEFLNPLAIIKSQTQLSQREASRLAETPSARNENAVHRLAAIERATRRLEVLFEQWLKNDRLIANALCVAKKKISLHDWLMVVVADSAIGTTNGREIIVHTDVESIWADEALLRVALLNLLDNANKYSPAGTPINISAELCDATGNGLGATSRGVAIRVSDHGSGIPDSFLEKIFERYFRVHHGLQIKGVGLGLYFVRRIAELHGGYVKASCPTDGGTTFTLWLPPGSSDQREQKLDTSIGSVGSNA